MQIKVLGTGCAKCDKLFDETKASMEAAGVEAELTKVDKLDEIISYGVALTPALVIDGQVKCSGKIPSRDKITSWLTGTK
jgi:small redox-active disulfide protein 2